MGGPPASEKKTSQKEQRSRNQGGLHQPQISEAEVRPQKKQNISENLTSFCQEGLILHFSKAPKKTPKAEPKKTAPNPRTCPPPESCDDFRRTKNRLLRLGPPELLLGSANPSWLSASSAARKLGGRRQSNEGPDGLRSLA